MLTTTSTKPSLSKSPKATPRAACGSRKAGPLWSETSSNLPPRFLIISKRLAIAVVGYSFEKSHFRKCAVAVVAKQLLSNRVVRYQNIWPSILVKIVNGNPQPFPEMRSNSGLLANFEKCAVALIVVEQ